MERQLFDWGELCKSGTASFTFYGVKLKVAIGDHPIGTEFSSACLDYQGGELLFYDSKDNLVSLHKLELKIL